MRTFEEIIDGAESLGWSVSITVGRPNELECEFRKYSPAGEDFMFVAYGETAYDLIDDVQKYVSDFDQDEHVRSVMNMQGAPRIKELVEDAEAIEEMLRDLAEKLVYGSIKRPSSEKWYATVRWAPEDIMDDDEDSLTYNEAAKWWEENERWFREVLIGMGNEALMTIDWDDEKRKLRKT